MSAPAKRQYRSRDGDARFQRIVEVIKRDPDLTNAQLIERFRASSGTVKRARDAAGVPHPEPFTRGRRIV